jgi:hypothetical protein
VAFFVVPMAHEVFHDHLDLAEPVVGRSSSKLSCDVESTRNDQLSTVAWREGKLSPTMPGSRGNRASASDVIGICDEDCWCEG